MHSFERVESFGSLRIRGNMDPICWLFSKNRYSGSGSLGLPGPVFALVMQFGGVPGGDGDISNAMMLH